ncbi:MAG TPA: MerR family transcriptional regulator [Thermoleophilaceae bacterium]
MEEARLRIGELSRRAGVSADVLRAWERRYGLLEPARTASGYRLYSEDDLARVQAMRAHIAQGLSAAEAAGLARSGAAAPPGDGAADHAAELWASLDAFDNARAQAAFDRLVADFTVETLLREAVLPYLRLLGDRWGSGDASVAQEHFASTLLRERLLALARGWDRGVGPLALLACAPGERHDLGLVAFGIALRGIGWRITFLGADTPIDTLAAASAQLEPDAVVVAALSPEPLHSVARRLATLAKERNVFLAGAGADDALAEHVGAERLRSGPLEAVAELVTASAPHRA